MATKEDPRADVSVFDLDELVIMPRSEPVLLRATQNGHLANGQGEEVALPERPRRQERAPRGSYARPLRRTV
jgi:hypothetical protein